MNRTLKTFLTVLAIAVAFLVLTRLFGDTSIGISFGDDAMTLTAPRQYSITVDYDDILTLELTDSFETGTQLSGGENRRYVWGEWENADGRCLLCVSKKIDNAVVVTTVDGERVLFNYESADTTQGIHRMLLELLADRAAS